MQKAVEDYISRCSERKKKQIADFLISEGITEYEFTPDGYWAPEYDHTVDGKYCKKIPIVVSDEELAEIKKAHDALSEYRDSKGEYGNNSNTVATILTAFSVLIYIAAFIMGIYSWQISGWYSLIVWVTGCFSGTLLLGFAEIIKLLHAIKNKPTI